MNDEAILKMEKYFKKNFPELSRDSQIILKPITSVDLNNNENVKNLINAVYMVFLSREADATSRLYVLIRQFCTMLREKDSVKELKKIYFGREKKLAVPNAEIVLLKYLSTNFYTINKSFSIGSKTYNLGDLNLYLQDCKRQIVDIFFEVYERHDLNVPINQLPNFANMAVGMGHDG